MEDLLPEKLTIRTTQGDPLLDLRRFHDFTSALQLTYGLLQGNDKYTSMEEHLVTMMNQARADKFNPLEFDEFHERLISNLQNDYELIQDMASTSTEFIKTRSALHIFSISKNSPLEIVLASSFFLLTLAVVIGGGRLKFSPESKAVEVELPRLVDGLKPLLEIFKKKQSSSSDGSSKDQELFE